MRVFAAVLATVLGAGSSGSAELPCSQVRLVVPYAAGGATDVAARLVAQGLENALKKTFVVETRAGATGNVGTAAVVNSPADGCTLLVNAAVIATFPYSFSKLPYDPIKDLVPVGGIGITPTLVVTSNSKVSNVEGLIAWSREKPDGLTFSTAGYGLLQHLAVEELALRSGAKLTHVPYRGGGQATADLLTGRLDFGSFAAGSVIPSVRDGRLKALAVVQEGRSALAPEVSSTAEQGIAGLNAGVHFMLFAPAGTPKEIVNLLGEELRKVVGDPALNQRFIDIGFDPTPILSDEASRIMRKTGEEWAPVIKRLNIRLD
jgi:tripartite-type tricarboxylate transporter receptor subunit TctC